MGPGGDAEAAGEEEGVEGQAEEEPKGKRRQRKWIAQRAYIVRPAEERRPEKGRHQVHPGRCFHQGPKEEEESPHEQHPEDQLFVEARADGEGQLRPERPVGGRDHGEEGPDGRRDDEGHADRVRRALPHKPDKVARPQRNVAVPIQQIGGPTAPHHEQREAQPAGRPGHHEQLLNPHARLNPHRPRGVEVHEHNHRLVEHKERQGAEEAVCGRAGGSVICVPGRHGERVW